MVTAVSTLISTTSTALYRKLHRTEVELEHQRTQALEQLATVERERARTERLVVLGRLAAGVAHEINNPLAYVRANVGLLKADLESDTLPPKAELAAMLSESLVGLDRIATITQDLQGYARSPSDTTEPTPIDAAIDDALRFTRARLSGFPIRREVDAGLPLVLANKGRVVQVLVNLIVNAADALEDAVKQGRARESLWIAVRASLADGRVRVEVVDNGPGLSPELEQKLFQPFVTTKAPGKGAGLGLALSFELIQRQGGELTGGNTPEHGARFSFSLPLAA
jgi:C4-dicarboxylate-specific signal transduction histidine kinase